MTTTPEPARDVSGRWSHGLADPALVFCTSAAVRMLEILAVTAFVLPTALLSAVTPVAAKLRLASTARTGTVIGGLSAASTAGALVGTFATGFVFADADIDEFIGGADVLTDDHAPADQLLTRT